MSESRPARAMSAPPAYAPAGAIRIRATHPYAFRSGQWASLAGVMRVPGFPGGDRECYLVEFPDGATDFWVATAARQDYEFAMGPGPIITSEQ